MIIGVSGRYKSADSGQTKIKEICLQVFYRDDLTMVISSVGCASLTRVVTRMAGK